MKSSTLTAVSALALAALTAAGCAGEDEPAENAAGGDEPAVLVGGGSGDAASALAGESVSPPVGGGGAAGALPGITVLGSGAVRTVPDVADWSFGVQAEAASAEAALAAAGGATEEILAALRDAGIGRDDLRTEQVSVYPRTSEDGRQVVGYTASSSVHATIRQLGRAGAVVDAAVGAGANQVYGPTLRIADSRAHYQTAMEAALEDARNRAQALAAKAGVTLGSPVAIVETGGSPQPVFRGAAADEAAASVPVEPGVQEVTATLSVTFAIS